MNITSISRYFINIRNIKNIRFLKTGSSKTEEPVSASDLIENAVTVLEEDVDDSLEIREQEIQRKRNKSRLLPQHRNMLHGEVPYSEPQSWIHQTVKYQRTMFGRYGKKSGVNPGICWPTREDLSEILEYEKIAYPYTIPEMMDMNKKRRNEEKLAVQKRQEDIVKKISKLDQWKQELADKISKKEADALQAKQRKDRLVEEVRRHFGFTVDPRDERFKEMLEKKEKEEKKNLKEAKRKAKEAKLMERLQQSNIEISDSNSNPNNKTSTS